MAPSRAVSESGSSGTASAFGVRPGRFDHQVVFFGAVDIARYRVRPIGRDELGLGEVIQAKNALGVEALHQERRARPIFRPRELDQLAQSRW